MLSSCVASQEAQPLGRLQRPGIAQIYEAVTADGGFGPQPYFAMEFVAGASLADFVEQGNLNLRARLELIAKICDAVNHAHQRGIIHRALSQNLEAQRRVRGPENADTLATLSDMASSLTGFGELS